MKFPPVLRRKAFFVPVTAIAVFYLFAWAGLPRLVHWQAEKQVFERSGHVLKMEQPQLNPFTLTAQIPKLSLTTPSGEQLLAFDELFVDVSGKNLFTGFLALEQIKLQNLHLNVALLPDGETNFTALLNAFKKNEPEDEHTELPAFLLSHLLVSNAVLDFQDHRTPQGLKTHIEPLNFELRDLATRSEKNGDFVLDAATNLGAALKLRAQIQLAKPSVAGELSLTGLNIAKLAPLLKPLLPTAAPSGNIDLALNFDVNASKEVVQPQVVISNITAEVRNFNIQAKPQGESASAEVSKLNINGGFFNLHTNKAEVANIMVTGLQLHHSNKTKAIELNAIELGPITLDLAEQHAQVDAAKMKGGQVNVKRNTDGTLDLLPTIMAWIPPSTEKPSKPWTYALNTVEISGIHAALEDQSMKPAFNLGLNNVAVSSSGISQNLNKALPIQASLNMASGGSITLNGNLTPANAAMQLNVEVNELALKIAQPFIGQFAKLELAKGSISTKGKATYNPEQQNYTGSLLLANLRLNETGSKNSFLQFKRLFTPNMVVNPKGLNIQRLTLEGLDTALLISKDKSTNLSRILVKNQKAETVETTGTSPAFLVNIERFNIANGEMDFADESLFIPFGTRIHRLEGVVNGLSNKPGICSELSLKGEVDEFGETEAKGRLNLLAPTAFMDIDVKFRNVEMKNLTPYSGTFANRKIESGKLSMNLKYLIENHQLNSSNQVIIDKLTLGERIQSPQGRDLPLELALAILEDSNGRIDLGLPITGNLNDPEFSYGAIVWKAIGNVLTKIVTAPFRALGALFGGSSEDFGRIAFSAGATTLSPSQREGLKKLGEALTTRPNLALTIQGTWAQTDKTAMQALQMRRAVALQTGEKPAPNEDPGPLALNSENTQKAIERLYEKRFKGSVKPPKTENFHAILVQKLQDAEEVSLAQLEALAIERQEQLYRGLTNAGVPAARLKTAPPNEAQASEDNTVSMGLTMEVNK